MKTLKTLPLDCLYRPNPKVNNREDDRNTREGYEFTCAILKACGAQGRWLARPMSKVTLRDRRFKARNLNIDDRTISITVRPGDSGSAWEFILSGPHDQHSNNIRGVFAKMATMLIDNSLRITFPTNGEAAPEAIGPARPVEPPKQLAAPPIQMLVKPEPAPEPDPILNAETPASAADARNFLSRLMVVNARIEKRENHLRELQGQKDTLDKQWEDIGYQIAEVEKAIAFINQEIAEDEEAKSVAQAVKLLKGVGLS